MSQKLILFIITISLALSNAVICSAQVEQGAITGSVTDESDALIAGAQVTVRNTSTGVSSVTQTNGEGYYSAPYLAPGTYEVSVESSGFKKARTSGINVTVGLTATINVKLEVGAVQNEVRVEASAVQLEQQSSSLGNVVGSRQILQLPLNGRNPYSLVTLAPGVMPAGNTGTGPVVNGGRSNTSEVLFDGAESRNSTTNDIQYTPPLESVAEFKVITNNFSSEYGRSGGGVLTAASRGGTNELHGSFYEFLRNDKLNANGWTNNRNGAVRPPFRRNEYGFSIGGPVYVPKLYDGRNKTFFFLNFEQTPQRSPDAIVNTLPTELQRKGDFSQTLATAGGAQIKIYDPLTTRPDPANPGRFIRDQFPNNQIPASRIDPIAAKIMEFYPLPNRSTLTQNYVLNNSRANDTTRWFMRFDQAIGNKQRLFLSIGRQNNKQSSPGVNIAFPGEGVNGERGLIQSAPRTYVLSDTVTFTPHLLGEFRFGMTRNVIEATPRSVGYDFTQLGFSPALKAVAKTLKFPRIDITDADSLGSDRASYFVDAEYSADAQAHLTWILGSHSLKVGFNRMFNAFNVFRPEQPSGQYSFSRAFTQGPDPSTASTLNGFGVATFLLGQPTGGTLSMDPSLAASQKSYGLYVQDDWKITRSLTFNLGMRWEYATPWTDRFNQLGFFDPDFTDPLTGRKGLLRFVGKDGAPREQTDPNKTNFAPRVGLAWQFMNNMVIRAGYGMFFYPGSGGVGAGAGDLGSGFLTQTPVFLGPPVAAPNTPPVGASLANAFQSGFFLPPSSAVGSSISTAFRDWPTPVNHQWNFNIQRTLPGGLLVEAAYVGNRGMRYWINRSRNAASTQYLSLGNALNDLVPNPFAGTITTGALSAATVRRSQLLLPYPHYTGVTQIRDAIGDSIYHGFTLHVEKKTSYGLTLQANYTLSKDIDNAPERFASRSDNFIDPNNLSISRAIASTDRPHLLVMNYIYELPFGPGKTWLKSGLLSHVLASWQVSGITTFASGQPMVIVGVNNTQLPGVSATALRLKDPVLPAEERTLNRYFDTTAFAVAPNFSLGNDSRTQPRLRIPGISTYDIGIGRNQRFFEQRVNLQFRAEMFNAFNHTQFQAPNGTVTSPDFGRITAANAGRTIQLGLRLSY
jgi:hypothetical protein